MNSIHDMGGMHGFGAIPIEEDEPVFHSEWEAKSLALTLAMGSWGRWTLDTSRHAREKLSGQDYLRFTYYERWIAALVNLMVEHGLVTEKELVERAADPARERCTPALKADAVAGLLASGSPVLREVSSVAAFRINQHVRTINTNPVSHTRLPRYARGRIGHIVLHHGAHVFPDSNAHGGGEAPQHLYSVRFSAQELWGPSASVRDSVTLDLWESYLEPADG